MCQLYFPTLCLTMYTTTAYSLPLGAIGTKCWDFIRRIYYIFIKNNMKGFPGGSVVKNPPANAEDTVLPLVQENPTCCGAAKPVSHNY